MSEGGREEDDDDDEAMAMARSRARGCSPDSCISVRSRIICICSLKNGLSLRISLIVCITSIEYALARDGPSPSSSCTSMQLLSAHWKAQ